MSDNVINLPEQVVSAPSPTGSGSPGSPSIGDLVAGPLCALEIYPFEGGQYTLTGSNLISVSVRKSIRGDATGQFDIQLPPGGPAGVNDPNTWSQIITPMSHVLIGMSRGSDAAIVLDGVVTTIGESQIWQTNQNNVATAGRGQGISGGDFSWFFNTFNYWALTFNGLAAGTPTGDALNFVPGSLYQLMSKGLIGGNSSSQSNPVMVAQTWFNNVMSGPSGILGNTTLQYQGSRIPFYQMISAVWENYPNVYIPFSDFFMIGEESWMAKFQGICPAPWYEFFVTTAPSGVFSLPQGSAGTTTSGRTFTMQSIPNAAPAGPQLVARVNPIPRFGLTAGASSVTPSDLDLSRWNALPLVDMASKPFGFLKSSIGFSAESARNFYQLNPTSLSTIVTNNTNNIPLPFLFIAAADAASVQRYGFRPQIGTTRWFFDPEGNAPQNQDLNVQATILDLTGALISWFHPQPLMANAEVFIPLSPSILIGSRFRYQPFKGAPSWDFYVESVDHTFTFGRSATTRLTLTRGLPTAVYQDVNSTGLLKAVYVGNATRTDGQYKVGLPAGSELSLQIITTLEQAADLAGHLAQVYVTPQSGAS